jgi:hypothetical protein
VELGLTDRDFQTKSLHSALNRFTITKEGRLVHHFARYVKDPDAPDGLFGGPTIAVDKQDRDTQFHGDILFYNTHEGKLVELVARFTHGQLEWLRPLGELSETERAFID